MEYTKMNQYEAPMPADSYSTAEHGTALNNTDFQALQETAHNFSRGTQDFSTDLCDCCEGPGAASGCLLAFFFPFWAHGIIGNEVAEGVGRVPAAFPTFCVYSLNCLVASLTPLIGAYHHPFSVSLALAMLRFNWQGRRKMREKYGIPNDGNDCLVSFFCQPCSLAQQMRHIRDTLPDRDLHLLENRPQQRSDFTFCQAACAPYY